MEIGDVVAVAESVVAELVGCAMDMPPFHPRPGEPDREAVGMVVAAVDAPAPLFEPRSPAKLRAEDDERLVEQPPGLEVADQPADREVDRGTQPGVVLLELLVRVPDAVRRREDLHEADAAFHEPAGREETLAGELRRLDIEAIESAGRLGLVGKADRLRHGGLHPVGELVAADPRS